MKPPRRNAVKAGNTGRGKRARSPVGCAVCGELPASLHADLARGESLPSAAGALVQVDASRVRRCPRCEAYFLYRHEYEFLVGGSDDDDYLDRIDRGQVVRILLEGSLSDGVVAELARLGVPDGLERMMQELRDRADAPDESTSRDAVHKLVTYFLSQRAFDEIDGLLRHPKSRVKQNTLYLLKINGVLPRPGVLRCLSDPDADVRNHAAWALRVGADRGLDVADAIPELVRVLASDPVEDVRRQAADALAAAAAGGADISAAIPDLARALSARDWSLRGSAAKALASARSRGADLAIVRPVLEACLSDPEASVRRYASEALQATDTAPPGPGTQSSR